MSEQSSQIAQPLRATKIIDDGPLVLDEVQTDELSEKTPGSGVITGFGMLPIGGIIAWSGLIANIPQGWALCDGTNGTPDLRERCIVGARADSGTSYDVGDSGGEATHTLTEDEMPAHTHTFNSMETGATVGASASQNAYRSTTLTTNSRGGSQAHNNMQPYYVLAWIMRVAAP